MSIFQAIVLGLVQGLTEFIPVSSSGHLLLAHEVFGTTENSLGFDVALHVGTLLALFVYFRKDIYVLIKNIFARNDEGYLARLLIIATIPAAVAGFLFSDVIDENFRSTGIVICTLAFFGLVMLWADRQIRTGKKVSMKQGLAVGFAQVLALVPGVSRSGATITAGLLVGLERKAAARFSFLLAMPIIAGSALGLFLKGDLGGESSTTMVVGMTMAFASGLFAIKFMIDKISQLGLKPFAYYRIALAAIVFMFLL
ncbi:undecaprenyl-diphosphate phosphatase [Candidatus Saccharibacteria bacterium]|nr:undecaprenyl-diphosphate phosphatase [Candidatus Saccharibacteria bacterium]